MTKKKQKQDISKLNFEQAITILTDVVEQIEDGQVPLADSIEKYEQGMALIRHCRSILTDAEKRIEKITAQNKSDQPDEPDAADIEDDEDEDEDSDERF